MLKFDISKSKIIAHQIESLNKHLGSKKPYLLVGPGRWGSSDPWLGIPTSWDQINNAKVIIELGIEGVEPDPSFGSHFFHNLTNLRIGYLTQDKKNKTLDSKWIESCRLKKETTYLQWFTLKNPLIIQIDGSTGNALILKGPIKEEPILDEDESSGI